MDKDTTMRIRKAEDHALESLGHILETYRASGFVETVGYAVGDTVMYRVYDDGLMYGR